MNSIRDKSGQAEFDAMRERSQHTKGGLLTDKMRYRKALLLACGGDEDKARQFLREVDGEPVLICLTPAECKSPVACEVKDRCLRTAVAPSVPCCPPGEPHDFSCPNGVPEAFGPGVTLSGEDARFLAVRLRRLCAHHGYELPKFADDDASLINIAGTVIGALLTNLTHGVLGTQGDKNG